MIPRRSSAIVPRSLGSDDFPDALGSVAEGSRIIVLAWHLPARRIRGVIFDVWAPTRSSRGFTKADYFPRLRRTSGAVC